MLAQILNRDFVLNQLELVQAGLEMTPEETGEVSESSETANSRQDLMQAASALAKAKSAEVKASSGQTGYDDLETRRDEGPALLDDFVFISSDPIISLLQTALQEYFDNESPDLVEDAPPPDDGRRGGDDLAIVTETSLRDCPLLAEVEDGRRLFNDYSVTDAFWVGSWIAEGIRHFRGRHPFKDKPADPVKIGDDVRLILVGDWGSGLPRARAVAREMRKQIDSALRENLEVHVIHLGDVYYSGWKNEYEKNFLKHWPVDSSKASTIKSWSLNGNHDMYSGGHAYFDFLLADPRFESQQQSSFFSLHNNHWDVLGLDTAWIEADLMQPQVGWLEDLLLKSPRKSMLLSHHQLFSAYDHGSPQLAGKMDNLRSKREIDVWFWGHEHRCVLYEPCQRVRHGRLIGNGGIPVYMTHAEDDEYKEPAFYEYRKALFNGLEHWALFGFAVADLHGATASVRYIDEFGDTFKQENIQ